MTTAELLAEVNTAISELVTRRVKEYELDGVHYTYSTLSELRLLRTDLLRQARTSSGTMRPIDISGVYNL